MNALRRLSVVTIVGVAALLLVSCAAPVKQNVPDTAGTPQTEKPAASAQFSFEPASGTYAVGDTFDVALVLDAGDATVTSLDVVASYDTMRLEVVDADDGRDGVQVRTGTMFEAYPLNEAKDGVIRIGAASIGSGVSGSSAVATVTFRAIGSGTAEFQFDFEPGSNLDTDVFGEESTEDLMSKVTNAAYEITE